MEQEIFLKLIPDLPVLVFKEVWHRFRNSSGKKCHSNESDHNEVLFYFEETEEKANYFLQASFQKFGAKFTDNDFFAIAINEILKKEAVTCPNVSVWLLSSL